MRKSRTRRVWVKVDVTETMNIFLLRGIPFRKAKKFIEEVLEIEANTCPNWIRKADCLWEKMEAERLGEEIPDTNCEYL